MGSRPHCILIPDSFSLFVLRSMGEIGIETLSADFCSGHEERSAPALNGREIALSWRGSQNANAHWGLACVTVDASVSLSLVMFQGVTSLRRSCFGPPLSGLYGTCFARPAVAAVAVVVTCYHACLRSLTERASMGPPSAVLSAAAAAIHGVPGV